MSPSAQLDSKLTATVDRLSGYLRDHLGTRSPTLAEAVDFLTQTAAELTLAADSVHDVSRDHRHAAILRELDAFYARSLDPFEIPGLPEYHERMLADCGGRSYDVASGLIDGLGAFLRRHQIGGQPA